ncbi:MAG: type 4a pilus biogenesis protein PilO [Candidatus Staskawiczbacteria bacterium]|nr:type 4a pilus biogenesis protein PilO [Candidatus Staskawiczbacteria bacterium]
MTIDRPITIALILFIILLLIFFLVAPEYNIFVKLRNDLAEKTAEYNAQYDYYAAIDKVYFDLQGQKEDLKKVDDALPQDPALAKLVYYLQDTAKQNGLMVKDLYLSKTSSGSQQSGTVNQVREVVFSTDLLGSYAALESFLKALEKSVRIFEVTSISFGSGPQSKSTGAPQSFSLQIKTFSY